MNEKSKRSLLAVAVCLLGLVIAVQLLTTRRTQVKSTVVESSKTDLPKPSQHKRPTPYAKPEIRKDLVTISNGNLPACLSVFVYNGEGAPVSRAKVFVRYSADTIPVPNPDTSYVTSSDDSGMAVFGDMPLGRAWVSAEFEDLRSEQLRIVFRADASSREIALSLPPSFDSDRHKLRCNSTAGFSLLVGPTLAGA